MYTRLLEYARDVYGWLESGAYPEEAETYVAGLHQQLRLEEVY